MEQTDEYSPIVRRLVSTVILSSHLADFTQTRKTNEKRKKEMKKTETRMLYMDENTLPVLGKVLECL